MRKKPFPFNVLLSEDDRKRLQQVAKARGVSQGLVVRQGITAAFLMSCRGVRCCADGARCTLPQSVAPNFPELTQSLLEPLADEHPLPIDPPDLPPDSSPPPSS